MKWNAVGDFSTSFGTGDEKLTDINEINLPNGDGTPAVNLIWDDTLKCYAYNNLELSTSLINDYNKYLR